MLAKTTSVAIYDAHPFFVEGVGTAIRRSFDYAVVSKGVTVEDLMTSIRDERPDLVVMDPDLPGMKPDIYERARFHSPTTRFIALTASRCVATAVRVLTGPVRGYVLKDRPADDLISAIRTVLDGGLYVTPTFAADVIAALNGPRDGDSRSPAPRLSRREEQIVQLLLEGYQNREIAKRLGLSERTIKGYMTNLMMKLGVRSRLEVVLAVQPPGRPAVHQQNALATGYLTGPAGQR